MRLPRLAGVTLARYLLLGEFEAALILAKNHSDFAGSFVLTVLRGQTSKNTLTFYCDPRVQLLLSNWVSVLLRAEGFVIEGFEIH